MYSFVNSLQNRRYIGSFGDKVILQEEGVLECRGKPELTEVIWKSESPVASTSIIVGNKIYSNTGHYLVYVLDIPTGQLIEEIPHIKLNSFPAISGKTEILIVQVKYDGDRQLGAYDLKNSKIVWTRAVKRGRCLFVTDMFIVLTEFQEDSVLKAFRVEDGDLAWQLNVEKIGQHPSAPNSPEVLPGKVAKIIGVWREELLVSLHGGKVIALDLADGTLRRSWWKLEEQAFKYDRIGNPYTLHFDEKEGKLFSLGYRFYWEIDLVSGSLSSRTLDDAFHSKEGISFSDNRATFNDTHLLILMNQNPELSSESNSYLTAVNRKNLKVEWKYELPKVRGEGLGIDSPRTDGNRLYFLYDGTLHIFERTT